MLTCSKQIFNSSNKEGSINKTLPLFTSWLNFIGNHLYQLSCAGEVLVTFYRFSLVKRWLKLSLKISIAAVKSSDLLLTKFKLTPEIVYAHM